jgi:hypothetical protein
MLIIPQPSTNAYGRGGIDEYTKLMVHPVGADGANNFVDDGRLHLAITPSGDAQIDDSSAPFVGGRSILLDGTGDYLTVANHADLDLGISGDPFTLETFVNAAALSGNRCLIGRGGGAANWSVTNGHMWMIINGGSTLSFQWNSAGSTGSISTSAPSTGAFAHVAVTYDGTNIRLFKGGVLSNTSGSVAGITAPTTRNITRIGDTASDDARFNGRLAEIRISKGIARWTSNFTPPTRPYW